MPHPPERPTSTVKKKFFIFPRHECSYEFMYNIVCKIEKYCCFILYHNLFFYNTETPSGITAICAAPVHFIALQRVGRSGAESASSPAAFPRRLRETTITRTGSESVPESGTATWSGAVRSRGTRAISASNAPGFRPPPNAGKNDSPPCPSAHPALTPAGAHTASRRSSP